jgi:prepilin-type N-terminal cleavage/methylation domain-containing protein
MNNRGYTIVELLIAITILASITLMGFICYILIHFIIKFW